MNVHARSPLYASAHLPRFCAASKSAGTCCSEAEGMHFSLPRFLRRVPSESLATYFEARGLNAVAKIQRSASGQHGVERVRQAIEALPESEFLRIYEDFDRVSQLASGATGSVGPTGCVRSRAKRGLRRASDRWEILGSLQGAWVRLRGRAARPVRDLSARNPGPISCFRRVRPTGVHRSF